MPGKSPGNYPISFRVFLESPVNFDPVIFPDNLPGNLRELWSSRYSPVNLRVTSFCCIKTKWLPKTDFCYAVCGPRTYQGRPVLNHMTDTEVVERHRLSTGRLNWLIERCIVQKIDLDRQQFTETQVNQYRLIVKTYPPTFGAVKLLMLIY